MNTMLNFMEKIYSDSKMFTTVYIVGAVLLFIFIILLVISIRKPDKKDKTKIIESPKIEDTNPKIELDNEKNDTVDNNLNVEKVSADNSFKENNSKSDEKITNDKSENVEIKTENIVDSDNEKEHFEEKTDLLVEALNTADETVIEEKEAPKVEVSTVIPDVDQFVDKVVEKAHEKNEQFSSVYVDDSTKPIELDALMDNLDVDSKVKDELIPKPISEPTVNDNNKDLTSTISLDDLKKAIEDKKEEVSLKQDDLKNKLLNMNKENTKTDTTVKAEDLLNKLNQLKK